MPAHRCGARARTRCAIRWGSAAQNPTGEVRGSHRVTHRGRTDCVAPTVPRRRLSRSRPPRSLSKLGVRLFSRERLYIRVCCTSTNRRPSCSAPRAARSFARVAHARRPRRPGGRAVRTPPTVTDTRFITYTTDWALSLRLVLCTARPHRSCARCRCSARDTRTCKHRPVDLRFTTLIRLQKVLLRRVEENSLSLFLRVGRQRWKLDEKVVPRLWCQEPSTAIAVTALAHCDVCAPESWCELIRAVRSVRG